jgi:hypothetical protein
LALYWAAGLFEILLGTGGDLTAWEGGFLSLVCPALGIGFTLLGWWLGVTLLGLLVFGGYNEWGWELIFTIYAFLNLSIWNNLLWDASFSFRILM